MGEGGRKLDQDTGNGLSIEDELRLDVKKSGTRRIPVPSAGEYSLVGRGVVNTERPGIFEDEEEDLDKTKVEIPRQTTLRPIDGIDGVDGVELPSFPENAQSREQVQAISTETVMRVNMASEHPSAVRDEKLPTIVDPIVAKARLHEAGVEDDLPSRIDSEQLPNVIDFRKKQRERVMGVVLKGGVDYAWPWWESSDPLVHVWCQLHSVSVVPDWKFKKDLQALIGDESELALCIRVHNGKTSFVKVEIERALLKRFSQAEIDARITIEKDLATAKKVTKK